jgi:hypothetical protein
MWAFSQAAWVVGDFVEANAVPVKATARPSATIVVTRLFILLLLILGAFDKKPTPRTTALDGGSRS